MPVPKTLAGHRLTVEEGRAVGDRLKLGRVGQVCGRVIRVTGGERFVCTRRDGHAGLCVSHDGEGVGLAVSRWGRRR